MKAPQIDDALIFAGLAVTIPHTAHILCQYEAQDGWGYVVAWSFAVFTDVGIARCSWVASNRQANKEARTAFGGGLVFLLAVSYSLNAAYYFSQKADMVSGLWLALVAPALLAILAAGKSFLDNKAPTSEKRKLNWKFWKRKSKVEKYPLVTSAADSSSPLDEVQAILLAESPQAKKKIKDMTEDEKSAFYKQRAALGRQAMLAKREAQ